jgi:pimeloyl-ACP methyl ester carboxylesterase
MDHLIEDAALVVQQLDLEHPVLAGHSWGATVALELVGARPDLFSAFAFIDGPVQSAANLFSWEDAQALMQPPLPRYRSLGDAEAESRSDLGHAWDSDLETFVKARVMPDGDDLIPTLTGPVRLSLLRGLYDSQPDVLWPRITVPTVVLLARAASANVSGWKEQGASLLAKSAPAVTIKWFDTPHDIPLYAPAEVAAEIVAISALASSSQAAAG